MSTPPPVVKEIAPRPVHRAPITLGPLGLPEAIALGVGLLLLVVSVLSYFLLLQPARAQQETLKRQLTDSRQEKIHLEQAHVAGETTQQSVERIGQSVVSFERNFLTRRETGRLTLYTLLNDLMKRNNVRNTSGPAYSALEPLKPEEANRRGNDAGQKGNDRWQTIYPGINVNVTVEGKYADLRRFLRDVEGTGQFIVINAVELEGTRNQNRDNAANANVPLTPPLQPTPQAPSDDQRRGERVNLRLDLAAYFQRDNLGTIAAEVPAATSGNGPR